MRMQFWYENILKWAYEKKTNILNNTNMQPATPCNNCVEYVSTLIPTKYVP